MNYIERACQESNEFFKPPSQIRSMYTVPILDHALATVTLVKPVQIDKDPQHKGNELHWPFIQHKCRVLGRYVCGIL